MRMVSVRDVSVQLESVSTRIPNMISSYFGYELLLLALTFILQPITQYAYRLCKAFEPSEMLM